jgi:hypothetical protein
MKQNFKVELMNILEEMENTHDVAPVTDEENIETLETITKRSLLSGRMRIQEGFS